MLLEPGLLKNINYKLYFCLNYVEKKIFFSELFCTKRRHFVNLQYKYIILVRVR